MHLMNGAIVVLSAGIWALVKDFKETALIGWKCLNRFLFEKQCIVFFHFRVSGLFFPMIHKYIFPL